MPTPATSGTFRTALEEMQIGDYIAFKYTASSGAAGVVSEIGASLATAQAKEIPVGGSATPNGYAYALKVAPGLAIADRVVQHSISWDVLNNAKMIQGKLQTFGTINALVRSLTGGVAYMGADGLPELTDQGLGAWPPVNEWDTYIVNSNLKWKITAGDDNVWHLNGWCWVKNTPANGVSNLAKTVTANSSYRTLRGYSGDGIGPKRFDTITSNFANAKGGFRPAFEFMRPNCKASNLYY